MMVRGTGPRSNTPEIAHKLDELRNEIQALEEEERRLDEAEAMIQHSLKALAEGRDNAQRAFVTYKDIRSIPAFNLDTVLAMKAPSGAELHVPEPDVRSYHNLFLAHFFSRKAVLLKCT